MNQIRPIQGITRAEVDLNRIQDFIVSAPRRRRETAAPSAGPGVYTRRRIACVPGECDYSFRSATAGSI